MSLDAKTLRARWIYPANRPPIRDGFVSVVNGRIQDVSSQTDGPFQDLGNVGLLPGLFNAHTHLEFSDLKAPLGHRGIAFPDWLQQVIDNRLAREGRPSIDEIALGQAECLASGTIGVGEIATHDWNPPRASSRIDGAHALQMVAFYEWISLASNRQSELVERQVRHLERCRSNESLTPGISPHAPYTLHPDLLERACDISNQRQLPIAMHLAESEPELELLASGTGALRDFLEALGVYQAEAFKTPRTPKWYLERLAQTPRALAVHGNYLTNSELDWLAEHRDTMSLVFCPRTHDFFGHAPYPLSEALQRGVRVVLGTDSRASNPDLSVWREFQFVLNRFPQVQGEDALKMVTIDAAISLGFPASAAMLAPGSPATIQVVPFHSDASDPWEALAESRSATLTNLTMT